VSAELSLLPPAGSSSSRRPEGGLRQHGFVAVLCASKPRGERKLTGVVQKAARKRLRRRFGPESTARITIARPGRELAVGWFSVRGTPHRF
jgi:hypothetical protein